MDTHNSSEDFKPHGAFLGHALPGSFFLIWGGWWLFATYKQYLGRQRKVPYQSVAWFPQPFPALGALPLEPIAKIFLTFVGIVGELWAGHPHFTYAQQLVIVSLIREYMFTADGRFDMGNINNWQHAAMYFGVLISGVVDLVGYYAVLPSGSEQATLAMAFVVEGLLFGFHLKGSELEVLVHLILVITIFMTALIMFLEMRFPNQVLLTIGRALLVLLQGVWFWQLAYMMFTGIEAWNPRYMGAAMMAPVLFCFDIMLLLLAALIAYGVLSITQSALASVKYQPLDDLEGVEMGVPAKDSEAQRHRRSSITPSL